MHGTSINQLYREHGDFSSAMTNRSGVINSRGGCSNAKALPLSVMISLVAKCPTTAKVAAALSLTVKGWGWRHMRFVAATLRHGLFLNLTGRHVTS